MKKKSIRSSIDSSTKTLTEIREAFVTEFEQFLDIKAQLDVWAYNVWMNLEKNYGYQRHFKVRSDKRSNATNRRGGTGNNVTNRRSDASV